MDHSSELWGDLLSFSHCVGFGDGVCSPFPECLGLWFDADDTLFDMGLTEFGIRESLPMWHML